MKFNVLSIVKAVTESFAHSKEYEAQCEGLTREPLCGYNQEKSIRAFFDPKKCRFTKIQIKKEAMEGRDLVDVMEDVTAALNDALDRSDELWQKLTPESIKRLDMKP